MPMLMPADTTVALLRRNVGALLHNWPTVVPNRIAHCQIGLQVSTSRLWFTRMWVRPLLRRDPVITVMSLITHTDRQTDTHRHAYFGRMSHPCPMREPIENHRQFMRLNVFSSSSGSGLQGWGLSHSPGVILKITTLLLHAGLVRMRPGASLYLRESYYRSLSILFAYTAWTNSFL